MNSKALYEKNYGLTAIEMEKNLKENKIVEPEVLSSRNESLFSEQAHEMVIKKYRYDARFYGGAVLDLDREDIQGIRKVTETTQNMIDSQSVEIRELREDTKEILKALKKPKRTTNKAEILRDPVPQSMLEDIITSERPKGTHKLTWERFQLTATILFFSGLRINELARVDQKMINDILEYGKMTLYQSKVNKYRTVRFTDHA